ncbi:hypothetical protein A9Z40_01260 [Microbacterium arborescens]|uniref:Uncharacterized protein n=1 Tax=Microbacterium arborescens TaxID=33883 RepID=A0ABX2WNP6_9MICO|nr:hypothetical protein [Microbacterium arborescens]OAZ45758.1 hypothetical protein A9Z40_01260 [Microbacterium arborescens]
MTPDLTTTPLPPRSRTDHTPRWEVRFERKRVGYLGERKIGRSSSWVFQAYVLISDRTIDLELDPDFERHCEVILQAWRAPSSSVPARYALGLPDPG